MNNVIREYWPTLLYFQISIISICVGLYVINGYMIGPTLITFGVLNLIGLVFFIIVYAAKQTFLYD